MRVDCNDFDDFEFEDSAAVRRALREELRERRRMASRKHREPGRKSRYDVFDENQDLYPDPVDFEDFEDYRDYDADEFDSYSELGLDRY